MGTPKCYGSQDQLEKQNRVTWGCDSLADVQLVASVHKREWLCLSAMGTATPKGNLRGTRKLRGCFVPTLKRINRVLENQFMEGNQTA